MRSSYVVPMTFPWDIFAWSDRRIVWTAFALSAALSVVLILTVGWDRGIGTDGAFYALSGYHFFHGHGFTYSDVPNTFTWPMLSLLVGFLSLMIDDLHVCMHVALTGAFALSVFPVFGLMRNFFGRRAAVTGVLLFALNGFLVRLSVRMLPEMLAVGFLVTGLFFLSRLYRDSRDGRPLRVLDTIAAGAAIGLAYLTKPEAGLYILPSVAAVFWFGRVRMHALWMILAFGFAIAPQVWFIHETTGKWQLTTYNRFVFRGAVERLVSASPGEVATDPALERNYNAYIVRGPYTREQWNHDIQLFPRQLIEFARSLLTIAAAPLLIAIGLLVVGQGRPRFLLLFFLPAVSVLFWYAIRDRMFLLHYSILLLIAVGWLFSWESVSNRSAWIRRLSLLGVFVLSYVPIANHAPTNAVIGNHEKLAVWMAESLPGLEGKLIADRKPYVTFAVKGRYFRYNNPPGTDSLVATLQRRGVSYLVVDDFYTRTKNPAVVELLDARDRPGLRFVHEEIDPQWGRAILYQVTAP